MVKSVLLKTSSPKGQIICTRYILILYKTSPCRERLSIMHLHFFYSHSGKSQRGKQPDQHTQRAQELFDAARRLNSKTYFAVFRCLYACDYAMSVEEPHMAIVVTGARTCECWSGKKHRGRGGLRTHFCVVVLKQIFSK